MNFRQLKTSSGKLVLLGKSDLNNEELINQVKPEEIVLHTVAPGSPFANIKGTPTKEDIKEAAIFTAKYSQDWRDNKSDVKVHIFKGSSIYKTKSMKTGTFGVKKFELIKIKKSDIIKFEKSLEEKEII